ncbi:salivary peroxidase/catechol oxidase [Lepeophtheirus salmonis]|uniref:salivary peroxidase/catechol oxidase n=1 Tax=Lepeophtheirus salmonis TaxID=72036 RepID=UPI001AE9B826|nr:peroxidase-like [Lepeophtheirus salmonis]
MRSPLIQIPLVISLLIQGSYSQSCYTFDVKIGQCKPLVKCVRFVREIPELEKQPCLLYPSGAPGVCCPHLSFGSRKVTALHAPIVLEKPAVSSYDPNRVPIQPGTEGYVVDSALKVGFRQSGERKTLASNLFNSGVRLPASSSARLHRLNQKRTRSAGRIGSSAQSVEFAALHISDEFRLTRDQKRFGLPNVDVNNSAIRNQICSSGDFRPLTCSTSEIYRRIDGSCNNFNNPNWGKANIPLERLLPATYDDGISVPRGENSDLPSARKVSDVLIGDRDAPSPIYTLLLMQWGQFMDHDITHSPIVRGDDDEELMCCEDGKILDESRRHPECFHIEITEDDTFYSRFGRRCMEFVRSSPSLRSECNLGPREQVNQITAFIDGSQLYGSEKAENIRLRLGKQGRLRVTKYGHQELLPLNPEECSDDDEQRYCFEAGDTRVNEQLHLTLMHTIWLREHNRIAGELAYLNPYWNDERLFQEARKIVGAQLQHITYNEWLPLILGDKFVNEEDLRPLENYEYSESYDPSVNPSITNVFSTAAFRFGHTLVQGFLHSHRGDGFDRKTIVLHETNFEPYEMYLKNAINNLINGITTQRSQDFDASFTQEITRRLFQGNESVGMDLVALNIQRGRDHGIQSYVRYRRVCGLSEIRTWRDFSQVVSSPELVPRLQLIYNDVDDVDVFIGGVMERKGEDGLVGETFRCIIGDQYKKLKSGDRFWYEEEGIFTPSQLQEIRNANIARVLCDNGENLEYMQPLAFKVQDLRGSNARVPCSSPSIPRIDLIHWKEL